ncbi:MAG: acyl--CoA ligase [Hyphomonas sp.]|nr:acyl--CoA ligase [Hyphomonas sp.]
MTTFTRSGDLFSDVFRLHGKWRRTREAVICGDQRLTWGDFNTRLNHVANAALVDGLAPGDRVIVLMSNGLEMLETLFGLIKAGLTSVPLNLSVSDEAIAGMIRDADARLVVCTEEQARRLEADSDTREAIAGLGKVSVGTVRGWRDFRSWCGAASGTEPRTSPAGDLPMNIIYSSGTTGVPKGIVHTQAGRRDWAGDLAVALRYHGSARSLVTIGLYSNISWVTMLCTALAGGTLVIEPAFDAGRFWRLCRDELITHSSMVPLQLQKIMEADPDPSAPAPLQAIMSAGSPLHADLKARLLDRFGPAIIELYGLTEGVITTLDPEYAGGRMASVGHPIFGTDIVVLDDHDKEVAPGEPGEIVATGRFVMPGYWRRPGPTDEASWTAPDGTVWLRTGDIGYVDPEGYLFIVDRKKDMILSGGQNIYPQDIEAQLVRHSAVEDVAVIGAVSRKWGETPLALVVAREKVDPDEITAWCNARLGKQQRLADVKFVDELPRNPNGKLLKRELREIFKDLIYD